MDKETLQKIIRKSFEIGYMASQDNITGLATQSDIIDNLLDYFLKELNIENE